jgi:hypothetical protein
MIYEQLSNRVIGAFYAVYHHGLVLFVWFCAESV